jgi:hypothetical protein
LAIAWALSTNAVDRSLPVTRTTVTLPANQELDTAGGAAALALSPDGRRLAYVARRDGRAELYLRELDAFEPKPMTGTEGAAYPFFSPDGQWVAFFADGKLKRVSVLGGAPMPICDAPVVGHGGTWAPDGTIVFDPGDSGLMRVAAAGGSPARLTSQDADMDARNLSWPQFLPDGRALLVTSVQDYSHKKARMPWRCSPWIPARGACLVQVPKGSICRRGIWCTTHPGFARVNCTRSGSTLRDLRFGVRRSRCSIRCFARAAAGPPTSPLLRPARSCLRPVDWRTPSYGWTGMAAVRRSRMTVADSDFPGSLLMAASLPSRSIRGRRRSGSTTSLVDRGFLLPRTVIT